MMSTSVKKMSPLRIGSDIVKWVRSFAAEPRSTPGEINAPPSIAEMQSQWTALVKEDRYEEAIARCLSEFPNPEASIEASTFLGQAYYHIHDYENSTIFLSRAIEERTFDYYSLLFLSRSLQSLFRTQEALKVLDDYCGPHLEHCEELLDTAYSLATQLGVNLVGSKLSDQFRCWDREGLLPEIVRVKLRFFERRDAELACLIDRPGEQSDRVSLRYLRSVLEVTAEGCGKFTSIGDPERIRVSAPSTEMEPASDRWVLSSTPYLAELDGASVIGGSSLVPVRTDLAVSDVLTDDRFGRYVTIRADNAVVAQRSDAVLLSAPGQSRHFPAGMMLSGLGSEHFGHWFAEFLPKLMFYEQHPRFKDIPIIVDKGMPASHYDFLKILAENSLILLDRGELVTFDKLVVAPTITFFPFDLVRGHRVATENQASWTASALGYIRSKVGRRLPAPMDKSDRVFISRKASSWRRLVNEDDIVEALQDLGFRSVCLEEHAFEDQVRMMQRAAFVVAGNGSALNNLVFCSIETRILVLGNRNTANWGGWQGPMSDLGYMPMFLSGTSVGDEREKHSDYFVSPDAVRSQVVKMLET